MGSITDRFTDFMELGKEIEIQLQRLAELRSSVGNIGADPFGSIGHGQGIHSDRTGRLAGRITDLEAHIRTLTEKERREERALNAILQSKSDGIPILRPRERAAIQMRYFDGLTWEQTAELMEMSDKGAKLAFRRGLDKLDAVYDADE